MRSIETVQMQGNPPPVLSGQHFTCQKAAVLEDADISCVQNGAFLSKD